MRLLRTELEQQKQDGADKESRINFLTAELERLEKLIVELNQQLNNQYLKEELERQGKLIDELVKESVKHTLSSHPVNCSDAKSSGISEILISNFSSEPFKVACDAETQGGGWTIILRRMDGSEDFYRNWTEYKEGFGDLNGEFFLGLDKIHTLTTESRQELLVILEDFEGNEAYESYEEFGIGNEAQKYVIHTLGKANGTAGDSLSVQRNMEFSTYDRDNDFWIFGNCAVHSTGAWWYVACHTSNLTGRYNDNTLKKGVNWYTFKGYEYSLKRAVMMIRPKN
ncbi:ficolin-2-like [Drosophila innubila]|uniref:ficolin-2-like n=1 Tax=Drosophila innubila TaxID=198719 RepID=UPI00148B96D7|nr:ficolin-2-like [Drosophila innubila]